MHCAADEYLETRTHCATATEDYLGTRIHCATEDYLGTRIHCATEAYVGTKYIVQDIEKSHLLTIMQGRGHLKTYCKTKDG